jgi:hypothetical protein
MPRNAVRRKLQRLIELLHDSESERAASARSALGAPSQYAGGDKRSFQNGHRRPLTAGGSKGDQDNKRWFAPPARLSSRKPDRQGVDGRWMSSLARLRERFHHIETRAGFSFWRMTRRSANWAAFINGLVVAFASLLS